MKKRLQGLIAGVLIGAMLTGGMAIAANTTTLYDVIQTELKLLLTDKNLTLLM